MPDKVAGYLEVGHNLRGEVIINGSKAAIDANGDWHIVFSQKQARDFAMNILRAADNARSKELQPTKGF